MIADEVVRLRREYEAEGLVESRMADDPITEFESWFQGVLAAGVHEPNAFVLATVDPDGSPSARALLMKDLTVKGLVFYTGMDSRKSRALRHEPRAAATFVWTELHRQVRLEGSVSELDPDLADAYFSTRPRGAQIAAHASRQSAVIADRDRLEKRFAELENQFDGGLVPRPAHWGGWLLRPDTVEFWQGRPNRFHDRVRYERTPEGWAKVRLAP